MYVYSLNQVKASLLTSQFYLNFLRFYTVLLTALSPHIHFAGPHVCCVSYVRSYSTVKQLKQGNSIYERYYSSTLNFRSVSIDHLDKNCKVRREAVAWIKTQNQNLTFYFDLTLSLLFSFCNTVLSLSQISSFHQLPFLLKITLLWEFEAVG